MNAVVFAGVVGPEVYFFIRFVIETGYKDVPNVDEYGTPLLCHTTPLHYLATHNILGRDPYVRKLFKIYDKFDVNYTDESGLTHFHVACIADCRDVVSNFLVLGQDCLNNCRWRKTGDSPLHLAVQYNRKEVAITLLRNGANPNLVNAMGSTPLHVICKGLRDDVHLAESLFEFSNDRYFPISVDTRDRNGDTPLHLALRSDEKKNLMKLLLRQGANPNSINFYSESTPLHILCNRSDDVEDLVVSFFETNDEVIDSLKSLLNIEHYENLGVQVNARDQLGNTPLHYVLDRGHIELVEFLLGKDADPNLANAKGLTPLHTICNNKFHTNFFLEYFLNTNERMRETVQVNAQDNEGNTPLHLALQCGYEEMAETLLGRGADPRLANSIGFTALHTICKDCNDRHALTEMLFKISKAKQQLVQVDARDNLGRTPLQWAVASFSIKTVEILFKHGADLSSFVFPTESHFYEALDIEMHINNFKTNLASSAMELVELLENKGYEMDRRDALTIMALFAKYGLFQKSADLEEFCWYDDEKSAERVYNAARMRVYYTYTCGCVRGRGRRSSCSRKLKGCVLCVDAAHVRSYNKCLARASSRGRGASAATTCSATRQRRGGVKCANKASVWDAPRTAVVVAAAEFSSV
ncbi:unnamed protein product [Trichogramma brassicae]|uniref:Uncharacterized protein n=1 Tax=Trichogramma brassicae TaxID=86971 RepID=A0A6H5HZK1_9HYME|nr:unnamed protein product [Trichogramma brassicae]